MRRPCFSGPLGTAVEPVGAAAVSSSRRRFPIPRRLTRCLHVRKPDISRTGPAVRRVGLGRQPCPGIWRRQQVRQRLPVAPRQLQLKIHRSQGFRFSARQSVSAPAWLGPAVVGAAARLRLSRAQIRQADYRHLLHAAMLDGLQTAVTAVDAVVGIDEDGRRAA